MRRHWQYTRLEELCDFIIGGDWGKDPNQDHPDFVEVLCIRGSEFREWAKAKGKTAVLRRIAASSLEKRKLREGDILVEISGGGPDQPVGRTVFIDKETLAYESRIPKVCTNFLRLVRLIDLVDKKFVSHYLTYFYNTGEIVNYQGGSNNLRNLRFSEYVNIRIPLPPLSEQHHIVAKLDTLFAHVDRLKVRLEKIPILLKQFRQAVLTQAVTGKLTEEWRGSGMFPQWKHEPIFKICTHTLGKMLDKAKNKGVYTLYLRNQNIRWFDFDLSSVSKMKASEEDRIKFNIRNGDILVCEGGEPGRCAIWWKGENEFIFQKALHRLRCKDSVLPTWIGYNIYLDSQNGKLQSLFTGTTIKHLTQKALSQYNMSLPSLEEQREIVRRVESLFAIADRIEAGYKTLKKEIDQLPQAVLAKAFRGELVRGDVEKKLKEYEEMGDGLSMAAEG